jgi:hypothetical protein
MRIFTFEDLVVDDLIAGIALPRNGLIIDLRETVADEWLRLSSFCRLFRRIIAT